MSKIKNKNNNVKFKIKLTLLIILLYSIKTFLYYMLTYDLDSNRYLVILFGEFIQFLVIIFVIDELRDNDLLYFSLPLTNVIFLIIVVITMSSMYISSIFSKNKSNECNRE